MSAVHYCDPPLIAFPLGRPFLEFRFERFAARYREVVLKPDCSVIHSGDPLRCFSLSIESACLFVLAIICGVRFGGRIALQFWLSSSAIRAVRLVSEILAWSVTGRCDLDVRKHVASDALSESHLCFRLEAVCRNFAPMVDCIFDPPLR